MLDRSVDEAVNSAIEPKCELTEFVVDGVPVVINETMPRNHIYVVPPDEDTNYTGDVEIQCPPDWAATLGDPFHPNFKLTADLLEGWRERIGGEPCFLCGEVGGAHSVTCRRRRRRGDDSEH